MKKSVFAIAIAFSLIAALGAPAQASGEELSSAVSADSVIDLGGGLLEIEPAAKGSKEHREAAKEIGKKATEITQPVGIMPFGATGIGIVSAFTADVHGVPVPVPAGYLKHEIVGQGLFIDSESAQFLSKRTVVTPWAISLCDVKINWQTRNSEGTVLAVHAGATKTGCFKNFVPSRVDYTDRTLKNGQYRCAVLYVGGKVRGDQCHRITK